MLKVCGERHQMIWYNGDENRKLDCPLCYTVEILVKANVLPIAYKNIVPSIEECNRFQGYTAPKKKGRPKGRAK